MRAPLVDPPEQQPIEHRVAEAALGLVGLARPQVGRRRLADDRVGDADGRGQLADLALVQVADRVERAGAVAEQRRVADQRLGLVAGPDDQPAPRHRVVVQDGHPHAGHEVAAPQGDASRPPHRAGRSSRRSSRRPSGVISTSSLAQPSAAHHRLGVGSRRGRRGPVRHQHAQQPVRRRSPRRRGTRRGPSRCRPTARARAARSRPAELAADELAR